MLSIQLLDTLTTYSIYTVYIDNIHFEHMVHRIYPAELQLHKANASDTEAAFLDINLSIHDDIVSTKLYEGGSICNEVVPINQTVLYLYALQLHSQNDLLFGYTTAKSQLSSSFPTLHNPLSRKGTKLH